MVLRRRIEGEGRLEFVSRGALDVTGHPPEDLMGSHRVAYDQLIHPEDRGPTDQAIRSAVANRVPYRIRYRIRTAHGAERWVSEQGFGVPEPDGAIRRIEAYVFDVTVHHRAEEELNRREAEARQVFEQSPTALTVIDASILKRRLRALTRLHGDEAAPWLLAHPEKIAELVGTIAIRRRNAAARALFGEDPLAPLGTDAGKDAHASLRAVGEVLLAAVEDRDPHEIRTEILGPGGDPRQVLHRWTGVAGSEDRWSAVLVSSVDLTEQIQSQARVHEAEERYRSLFEQSSSAIVVIDPARGETVQANAAAATLFGVGRDALAEIRLVERLDVGSDAAHHVMRAVCSEGERFDARLIDALGEERDVLVALRRVEFGGRRLVQAQMADVTDRARAERALAAVVADLELRNADLERFAYFVSHDLHEPLRMVAGFVQLLAERYAAHLDERAREYVAFALDGVARMDRMSDDLLAYSRASSRQIEARPLDPRQALDAALRNLRAPLQESGAEVVVGDLPPCLADETLLGLVFQNLVANALKFHAEQVPRIEVWGERQGERILVRVRDKGRGIDPSLHQRVFQMFQRAHDEPDTPGTGVGLSICQRVVERLEGQIGLDSGEGAGATFWFTLPAVEPAQAGAPALPEGPA